MSNDPALTTSRGTQLTDTLLGLPFRQLLRPAEVEFVQNLGARSSEMLYERLTAARSLDVGGSLARQGIRRRMLTELASGLVTEEFRRQVRARLKRPRRPPSGAALAPDPGPMSLPAAELVSRRIPSPIATDLSAGIEWPIVSQDLRPTCVGFASAHCVELMRARKHPQKQIKRQSAIYLYRRMRQNPPPELPPDWNSGATKLSQASAMLLQYGICSYATWGQDDPGKAPSQDAVTEAANNVIGTDLYYDWGDGEPRVNIARTIYEKLRQGRPVAIALPEFYDQDADYAEDTDWHLDSTVLSGEVPDPSPASKVKSGHAVCIIGFQPGGADPLGGYFLFRNSWGPEWAAHAPQGDPNDPPCVPGRGLGTISALHLELHASEMLSLSLPAVPA
ncbi:C1 family peptidase [Roseococcus sp. YIM B11640]|uniref:C1 family peptidase n=1 Tax=Roseococcus sp. YIM B11640 TaxID=3133973 RepID=UPI003C79AE85